MTTVSDEPTRVDDETPSDAPGGAASTRLASLRSWVAPGLAEHRAIVAVVAIGFLLRAFAVLGYRPAMWFNDGFEYLGVARRFEPYPIRPNGYSAMLRALQPLHSFAAVTIIQHLMGLAIGIGLYALLRRWGLPGWLAALGAVPQLLDANQIQLEHVILSDTLFTFLLIAGLLLLVWREQLPWQITALAGLALAGATLTRSMGLPVLAVAGLWLIVRRTGWRQVGAFALAGTVPLAGYAAWFHSHHGEYGLVSSDGVFLYSRVAIFADCDKIDPPEHLEVLCEDSDPSTRGDRSSNYLWHKSPLNNIPGTQQEPMLPPERFSPDRNGPAGEFARATILAQPIDYLKVAWKDILRTFQWGREPFPNAGAYSQYPFGDHLHPVPGDRVFVPGGTVSEDTRAYEHGDVETRRIQPFADWLATYQDLFAVRGTFLLVLLVVGGGAVYLAFRRASATAWPLALLGATAVALVFIPPFTAQYDLRYVIPAVPILGAASACAVGFFLEGRRVVPAVADADADTAAD